MKIIKRVRSRNKGREIGHGVSNYLGFEHESQTVTVTLHGDQPGEYYVIEMTPAEALKLAAWAIENSTKGV